MPTNLLLLPLLGGYWFLHNLYYTKFRSQRLDGYRLLLESALAGVASMAFGRLLVLLLRNFGWFNSFWADYAPDIPYLETACVSLILGVVSPHVLNFFLGVTGLLTKEEARLRAIRNHGNHLLQLLHTAYAEGRTVSLTLDNRKVYIGLVANAPNLEPHETFLTITPLLSGYRNERLGTDTDRRLPARL